MAMRFFFTFLLLLLFYSINLNAQQNDAIIPKDDFYYELPFEYDRGAIIIKAGLGNETYNFLFDTGALSLISNEIKSVYPIVGTQQSGKNSNFYADSIVIAGLAFKNVAMRTLNLTNLPALKCKINGGFIGANIISKCIWQIDYGSRKIIVTNDKRKLPGLKGATKIPVSLDKFKQPYIDLKINGKKQKTLFDTGSNILLELGKTDGLKFKNTGKEIFITGAASETTAGRKLNTVTVMEANYSIGALQFKNKPVFFGTDFEATLLGCPIIENYIVTLNFPDNEMYLKPFKEFSNESWERYGFGLKFENGQHKILSLFKGSNAEKAGLLLDDIVVAINGDAITCNTLCDCLDYFESIQDDTTQITLSVNRYGSIKNITLLKCKVF